MSESPSAHPNAELITKFYASFQQRDAAGMNACYADNVTFSDPVFQRLDGDRARAMWRMLASADSGLQLTYNIEQVDDTSGTATWVARYRFTGTGRNVENRVTSRFWFEGGKIVRQEDSFGLWRWASMALGPRGLLLGWLPPVQSAIRKQAAGRLEKFMSAQ